MTSSYPGQPQRPSPGEEPRKNRVERRRDRIRDDVRQARTGRHIIPTWLMATILALFVAGWLYLIITK